MLELALSTGYAHNPLRLTSSDGSQHLSLVEHQAFFDFGAAVTYDRLRVYVNLSSPLLVEGESGTIDAVHFPPGQSPDKQHDCSQKRVCADLGWNPDTISDARIGFDARLLGDARSPLRVGISTQLILPAGHRADYVTDGTVRSMDRLLFAGDLGRLSWAGQLGVHFRRLNDTQVPGSPRGSEMLFGFAAGPKWTVGRQRDLALILGPEIYGATAFRALLGSNTTALEGLLSGRVEGTGGRGAKLRIKLGGGVGLHPEFGAPDYRFVFAIETFDRRP